MHNELHGDVVHHGVGLSLLVSMLLCRILYTSVHLYCSWMVQVTVCLSSHFSPTFQRL